MSYLLIVLFSSAITVVFVRGAIFEPLRTHGSNLWKEFAACALCVGVWVGAGATFLASSRGLLPAGFPVFFAALGLGSLSGAAALLYVRVIDWLEAAEASMDAAGALNTLSLQLTVEERDRIRAEREKPGDPGA